MTDTELAIRPRGRSHMMHMLTATLGELIGRPSQVDEDGDIVLPHCRHTSYITASDSGRTVSFFWQYSHPVDAGVIAPIALEVGMRWPDIRLTLWHGVPVAVLRLETTAYSRENFRSAAHRWSDFITRGTEYVHSRLDDDLRSASGQ